MVLQLLPATAADVDDIATIHLAAFDSNVLLHAQFPTPESLSALRSFLSREMMASIQNPRTSGKAILVVKDTDASHQIISFAKWDLPSGPQGIPVHPGVTWHKDCRQEYLDQYHEKAEAAKRRVVGDQPCYRLTFVGTLPDFQGRGAGTLLTQWGLSKAKKDRMPVYLESTIAAALLYRRLGFVALDGLSMTLPGSGLDGGPNIYEEVGMLRTWDNEFASGMDSWDSTLSISSLHMDYEAGIKPQIVVQAIHDRIDACKKVQPSLWIHLEPLGEVMRKASEISIRWPNPDKRPPLWGVPFSVKDSIDIAGIPTTTGCPALAFTPTSSAPIYERCIDAGALFIGKTNMEQLATGMTGCRSPYGTLHSTFSSLYAVGGSSSGSAVSVSEDLVSFSLGSDTAGSIRVPALFNGVVGFKPTKGTVSTRGVSPACLHQDCVSFLASTIEDAERVWGVCKGFDKADVFAKLPIIQKPWTSNKFRIRFGIPPSSTLMLCSPKYRRQFSEVIRVISTNGGVFVDLDWNPFSAANDLLYNSSLVTERLTILPEGWLENNKSLLHPVTRAVFESIISRKNTAVDVFKDLHKQAAYKRAVEDILTFKENPNDGVNELTVIVVPTTPFHPTIAEVENDPIGINSKLGAFAHFANVLDLAGIAIPCGTYETEMDHEGKKIKLPFGVTVLTGAGLDAELLSVVAGWEDALRDIGQDN